MKLIEHLKWRYATKLFDPTRKISLEDLRQLQEAIRLTATSYGLQQFKVLVIEDSTIRKQLRQASWDQSQITDASHLFVFCNFTTGYDELVDDYINRIIEKQDKEQAGLRKYGESIKSNIKAMSDTRRQSWAEKQTYLALSNLLTACAELKIDACPMEGFDRDAYNELLELKSKGLNAAVIAPVGYRSVSDDTQYRSKIRKPTNELFDLI